MEEPFILSVHYKGQEREYEAQLQLSGYLYKFKVTVGETEVLFEQDEEGCYRAIVPYDDHAKEEMHPDKELLQAIAHKIEAILA